MDLSAYQQWVKKTTYGDMHGVELLIMSNALGGECGELQNVVKKIYRDGVAPTEDLISEAGDVLWYLAAVCNAANINLEDVLEHNVEKINGRQSRQV